MCLLKWKENRCSKVLRHFSISSLEYLLKQYSYGSCLWINWKKWWLYHGEMNEEKNVKHHMACWKSLVSFPLAIFDLFKLAHLPKNSVSEILRPLWLRFSVESRSFTIFKSNILMSTVKPFSKQSLTILVYNNYYAPEKPNIQTEILRSIII